jgi:hypothetical protein
MRHWPFSDTALPESKSLSHVHWNAWRTSGLTLRIDSQSSRTRGAQAWQNTKPMRPKSLASCSRHSAESVMVSFTCCLSLKRLKQNLSHLKHISSLLSAFLIYPSSSFLRALHFSGVETPGKTVAMLLASRLVIAVDWQSKDKAPMNS